MKWMFVGLFLAALLIGAGLMLTENGGTLTFANNNEALKLMQMGSNQIQAFQFNEGIKNLEAALVLDPSLAEAAIPLATAYGRKGQREEYKLALARADSLTALIPEDTRRMLAQLRLGFRHKSGFSGTIDSLLTRLKKEAPNNIHVMTAIAELHSVNNEPNLEFLAWHNILEKNPNFAQAYNRLGYFELNRGNYEQAIEHMMKYAFLAPNLANPHDSLGDVLTVMGEYEKAAQEYRESVAAQPDFYDSYINLGKTYLYRGKIKAGLDLMDQVHEMVVGTDVGLKIDRELLRTYLVMDMMPEVSQMIQTFIERYPENEMTVYYQSIKLAHLGQWKESQALRDSCFNNWRSQDFYIHNQSARANIDLAEKRFEAYVADLADQPSTRVRKWSILVDGIADHLPLHQQRDARIKLASAYLDNGEPEKALTQLRPILEVNNRLVPALVVAIKTDLALRDAQQARMALEQLKWSIQQSDEDYKGRAQAAELETLVLELEGHS